jgi:hypothetical protein
MIGAYLKRILFGRRKGARRNTTQKGQREELLREMRESSPRTISTVMQTIEGFASEDNVGYVRDEMSFMEPDATPRQVTLYSMKLCDCSALISQSNPLKGKCQSPGCGRLIRSQCSRVCICGGVFCPKHAKRAWDGKDYCSKCRLVNWLRLFFQIGTERKEG